MEKLCRRKPRNLFEIMRPALILRSSIVRSFTSWRNTSSHFLSVSVIRCAGDVRYFIRMNVWTLLMNMEFSMTKRSPTFLRVDHENSKNQVHGREKEILSITNSPFKRTESLIYFAHRAQAVSCLNIQSQRSYLYRYLYVSNRRKCLWPRLVSHWHLLVSPWPWASKMDSQPESLVKWHLGKPIRVFAFLVILFRPNIWSHFPTAYRSLLPLV